MGYSQNTLNQAENISKLIAAGGETIEQTAGLRVTAATRSEIRLDEGEVTGGWFKAGDDLRDSYTGDIVYHEGEDIPAGTVTGKDWTIVDREKEDTVHAEQDGVGFIPDDLGEIDNGTKDTTTGMDRVIDNWINNNYEERDEWMFGYVSDTDPAAVGFDPKDELVCLGHLYDQNRQNAIVISSTNPVDPELEAPAMAQYNNIDTFGKSISKFRMTAIAANGNEFMGSFLVANGDTYMDINERINIFINDINSGLEAVGIHLDGEKSTITLVGTVNLRQHSGDSYDTLNVFDNLNTKRVEITPFDIPKRNAPDSNIDITKLNFTYNRTTKTATSSYVKFDSWKNWHFWPFTYSWVYEYTLQNYIVDMTTSVDLGYITGGSIIDLSKLDIHLFSDLYLAGTRLLIDRGTNAQDVTTFTYTLKRNGVAIPGMTNVNLLNNNNLTINGINTADIGLAISGTFVDDYVIQTTANYTLDIHAVESVFGYYKGGTKYSNYYIKVDTGIKGDVTLSIARTMEDGNMADRKLTIGTNGLSFTGNNSRYFYVATDGYEMKWDDAAISVDSTYGVRMNKMYRIVNGVTTLQPKHDIVICNYSSGGYSVYLPDAVEYGNGRTLTIIGFGGLKVFTSGTNMVRNPTATYVIEAGAIEFGSGTLSNSFVMPKYSVQLMSANSGWYVISYI